MVTETLKYEMLFIQNSNKGVSYKAISCHGLCSTVWSYIINNVAFLVFLAVETCRVRSIDHTLLDHRTFNTNLTELRCKTLARKI